MVDAGAEKDCAVSSVDAAWGKMDASSLLGEKSFGLLKRWSDRPLSFKRVCLYAWTKDDDAIAVVCLHSFGAKCEVQQENCGIEGGCWR